MRILKFLVSLLVGLVLTGWVFHISWIWACLYLDSLPGALVATAVAVLVPWILNQALTRSYRRIEQWATPWNSLLGMTIAFQCLVLGVTGSGWFSHGGTVSFRESVRALAHRAGRPGAAPTFELETLPGSYVLPDLPAEGSALERGATVWVPNFGDDDQPWIVQRNPAGELKLTPVEAREQLVSVGKRAYMVGKTEARSRRLVVMPLVPDARRVLAAAPFDGGRIQFIWTRDRSQRVVGVTRAP